MNDLLDATGIKKGTLYYHLSGKDELGLAVLERAKAAFLVWIEGALVAPSPQEGLQRFFDAVLERHRMRGFMGGACSATLPWK